MDGIKRDLEEQIPVLSEKYPCVVVTGPRQAGKTTLLKGLMDEKRTYVNLEDFEERRMAKKEPVLFLQMHPLPIFIDEVQYAPELLVYIKIAVDNGNVLAGFLSDISGAYLPLRILHGWRGGLFSVIFVPARDVRKRKAGTLFRAFECIGPEKADPQPG